MPRKKPSKPTYRLPGEKVKRTFHLPGTAISAIEVEEVTLPGAEKTGMNMARLGMTALCERADPNFWSPRWYDEAYALLTQSNPPFPVHRLGEFLLEGVEGLTYGSTATGEERQILDYNAPGVSEATHVRYIKSAHVLRTGLDIPHLSWTPKDGALYRETYLVQTDDIIMNKSGVGTAGRCAIVPQSLDKKAIFSQHTMRIRLRKEPAERCILPAYIVLFFYSQYGAAQFARWTSGAVGTVHIDFNELRQVQIPLLPRQTQEKLTTEFHHISDAHERATHSKDPAASYGWQATAMGLMEVLIYELESIIREGRTSVRSLLPAQPALHREAKIQYQHLGEYLLAADVEGKAWVEKLFGLRLYRFPEREARMEEFLSGLEKGQVLRLFTELLQRE